MTLDEALEYLKHKQLFDANALDKQLQEEGRLLGSGSYGAVYSFKEEGKVLKINGLYDMDKEWVLESVGEEGRIMNHLQGIKHIPKLYLWGTGYLVMEYIEGQAVSKTHVDHLRGIPKEEWLSLCYSLEECQKRGIRHSDVSLSNIMVYKNKLTLIDFGLYTFQYHECLHEPYFFRLGRLEEYSEEEKVFFEKIEEYCKSKIQMTVDNGFYYS